MTNIDAIIYGAIQGVTELFPISSSGHLALLPYILKIKDPGTFFDLAMHLGTAMAMICFFYRDILQLIRTGIFSIVSKENVEETHRIFFFNFLYTTLWTVVAAFVIKPIALSYGRSSTLIALNLMVFGLVMVMFDRFSFEAPEGQVRSRFLKMEGIIIGLAQGLALFPGVSRSGITLTAARGVGLARNEAARFSLLLGLPPILGGIILNYKEYFLADQKWEIGICLVGIITSFFVGLFAIRFFLHFLTRFGLFPYFFYRVILGFVILLLHYY